jgi:hypothetical protein
MWTPPNCFATPTTMTVLPVCVSTSEPKKPTVALAVQLPLHEPVQAGAQQHLNLCGYVRTRS